MPKPQGWQVIPPHWRTNTPSEAKTGRHNFANEAKEVALMSELGLATESLTPVTQEETTNVEDEEVPADDA